MRMRKKRFAETLAVKWTRATRDAENRDFPEWMFETWPAGDFSISRFGISVQVKSHAIRERMAVFGGNRRGIFPLHKLPVAALGDRCAMVVE
jgi:hypothetical protein